MNKAPLGAKPPWYREPWPWLLMVGPGVVIVAGVITAVIAIKTNDGLVTEDYYKKGLAVNQTIAQSERAARAGLQAALRVTAEQLSLRLTAADPAFVAPAAVSVTMSHPTRAGLDQTQTLVRNGETYAGAFRLPASGHWLVLIEDEARSWRLMGNVILPAADEIVVGGPATHTTTSAADLRR